MDKSITEEDIVRVVEMQKDGEKKFYRLAPEFLPGQGKIGKLPVEISLLEYFVAAALPGAINKFEGEHRQAHEAIKVAASVIEQLARKESDEEEV